jgi:hypothetical protein
MSVRRALEQQDEHKRVASRVAIKAEIKQLMDVKAFQPVHSGKMNEQTKRKVIPSHMFLKEKLLANGEFDKMKARLVAGGNYVDPRSVGETNAPTVNPFTVFFMLNVAAEYALDLLTADIKGASLIPDIVEGTSPDVHVWIEKSLSEMFVEMYPNLKEYVCDNGKLIFKDQTTNWGMGEQSNSSGAAYTDLDNDGDLDLVVNNINSPAFIYQNEANTKLGNQFLKLKLNGENENKMGIAPFALVSVTKRIRLWR